MLCQSYKFIIATNCHTILIKLHFVYEHKSCECCMMELATITHSTLLKRRKWFLCINLSKNRSHKFLITCQVASHFNNFDKWFNLQEMQNETSVQNKLKCL